ncbi:MAG: hypothetical protein ACRD29_00845 [Acidimicrobiales bacterium]
MSKHVDSGRSAAVETHATTRFHLRCLRKMFSVTAAVAVVAVAVGVVAVVPATPANALVGCAPAFEVTRPAPGTEEYRFRRCGVPDFDQLRTWLTNGGTMYRAPTSAADWMVYLAERGASSVLPGPGHAEDYGAIDLLINDMGNEMGTSGTRGTSTGQMVDGLIDWFDRSYGGRGGDYFAVHSDFGTLDLTDFGHPVIAHPTGRDLAAAAAAGSLVMPTVGWYEHNGRFFERREVTSSRSPAPNRRSIPRATPATTSSGSATRQATTAIRTSSPRGRSTPISAARCPARSRQVTSRSEWTSCSARRTRRVGSTGWSRSPPSSRSSPIPKDA